VTHFREALETARRVLGEDHFNTIAYGINLGRALEAQGDAAEAERLLRWAASKLDTANAAHRAWYLNAESGLGMALVARGRAAEGLGRLERAVRFARHHFGEEHVRTADARLALGSALLATGARGRAEPILRAAAAALEEQRKTEPQLAAQAAAALAASRNQRRD
jgi:hypothetical protein